MNEDGPLRRSELPPLALHIRKWRAAVAVSQVGSTARAADALHLSQPAVARSIRGLEDALELLLFERGAQGMTPTVEGGILLRRIERAFEHLRQAERELATPPGDTVPRLAAVSHRALEAYLAVQEAGTESRAAQALGVTQPAVNQALRQLEHLAGARLLQRTGSGLRLTAAGEVVLRRGKLALAEFRLGGEDLDQHFGRMRGRVIVGALPLSSGFVVPLAVERLLSRYPALNVTVVDGTYVSLLHDLRHADVDLIVGALRDPPPVTDIRQEPLFEDTLSAVVRSAHPWAVKPAIGALADLSGASWVTPLSGTPARDAFERAFAADGLAPPRGDVQVNSPAVVRALLLESDRVALLSRRQVFREVRAGLLTLLPIPIRGATRVIGITTRSDHHPSAAVLGLLHELRQLRSMPD